MLSAKYSMSSLLNAGESMVSRADFNAKSKMPADLESLASGSRLVLSVSESATGSVRDSPHPMHEFNEWICAVDSPFAIRVMRTPFVLTMFARPCDLHISQFGVNFAEGPSTDTPGQERSMS